MFPKFPSWAHINDLPDELKSNVKLFADDTSLFTFVKDKKEIAQQRPAVNLYTGLYLENAF